MVHEARSKPVLVMAAAHWARMNPKGVKIICNIFCTRPIRAPYSNCQRCVHSCVPFRLLCLLFATLLCLLFGVFAWLKMFKNRENIALENGV